MINIKFLWHWIIYITKSKPFSFYAKSCLIFQCPSIKEIMAHSFFDYPRLINKPDRLTSWNFVAQSFLGIIFSKMDFFPKKDLFKSTTVSTFLKRLFKKHKNTLGHKISAIVVMEPNLSKSKPQKLIISLRKGMCKRRALIAEILCIVFSYMIRVHRNSTNYNVLSITVSFEVLLSTLKLWNVILL